MEIISRKEIKKMKKQIKELSIGDESSIKIKKDSIHIKGKEINLDGKVIIEEEHRQNHDSHHRD